MRFSPLSAAMQLLLFDETGILTSTDSAAETLPQNPGPVLIFPAIFALSARLPFLTRFFDIVEDGL